MERPLRIGLVGFGTGGRFFHAPILASLDPALAILSGVVTRNPERAAVVRERFQATVFGSLDELLNAGVDLVVLTTPPNGRAELARSALDAGVATIVDKPMAIRLSEARELADYAAERGVPFSVFHNRRWDSEFLTVQRLLAAGSLGTPLRFDNRIERWEPHQVADSTGGGYWLDLGSHLVDQQRELFGPVRRVLARMRWSEQDTETAFHVFLEHESGFVSESVGDCLQPRPAWRMRFGGTEGDLWIGTLDVQTEQVLAGHSPATLADWGVEPAAIELYRPDGRIEPLARDRGDWLAFYQGTVAALRSGGELPVSASSALATYAVLDAAVRSTRLGGWIAPEQV